METLTEAITRSLAEKYEPIAVAKEMVDGKVKALIPHLKDGSCIYIRNIYTDIPEFEIQNLESVEIFIKEEHTDKVVVIWRTDMEREFGISNCDYPNPVELQTAVDAIHNAFYKIPDRCPYFTQTGNHIVFKVNI